jgi:TP901 family phage tail tape measure protein
MAKVSFEIEAVNKAQAAISSALKQLEKLTKAAEDNQKVKKEGVKLSKIETAARNKLLKAIAAEQIDKRLAQLEKEAIAHGALSKAISKESKLVAQAAAKKTQAGKKALAAELARVKSAEKAVTAAYKAEIAQIKKASAVRKSASSAKATAFAKEMKAFRTTAKAINREIAARGKAAAAAKKQRDALDPLIRAKKNLAKTKLAAQTAKEERAMEAAAIAAGRLDRQMSKYHRTAKRVKSVKTESMFNKVGKAAMRLFFIYETGVRILRMLGGALVKPIVAALKSFAAFQSGMAEVSTLLGKDLGSEAAKGVEGLSTTVKELAIEFGKAPVDVAKALYFAVSAGATNAADAQKVLRASTMLATAGLVDAETSTRALVTVMNAFGISYTKAEAVSDQFFVTVQKGITTVKELATKIGRVAGMAGAAGMSIQTMFAFIAAGTKVTGLTAATVTGLRSAIQLILKPGKQAREVFDRLKIAYGQNAIAGEGLAKLVSTLRDRLRGVGKGARITATDISKMIPNMRASAVIMALLKSETNEFTKTLNILNDTTQTAGATQAAVAKIMETLAFKMEKLKSAFEVVKIEFGGNFSEAMELGSILEGISNSLIDIYEAFKKIGAEKDIAGMGNMKKQMEEVGEGFTFIVFEIGTQVITFMGRVASWLADLRVSAAWAKQLVGAQDDLPPSQKELGAVSTLMQQSKPLLAEETYTPGTGYKTDELLKKRAKEGAVRVMQEGSQWNQRAKNFLNSEELVQKALNDTMQRIIKVTASSQDRRIALRMEETALTRLKDAQAGLIAKIKSGVDHNALSTKEIKKEIHLNKERIAAKEANVQKMSKENEITRRTSGGLRGLNKAYDILQKRLKGLKKIRKTGTDELSREKRLADSVDRTYEELLATMGRLKRAYLEQVAARKAGAEDTSGIKAVIEAVALDKTITKNETNANKTSKKLGAAKTDALVLEYARRWRLFIGYTNKVKAAEEKALRDTGKPMVRSRMHADPIGKWGAQDISAMPGPDVAMTKTMLKAAEGWFEDYAKGTMSYTQIQKDFIINATKGFTKAQRSAFLKGAKLAESTLGAEAALAKKLSAAKLALRNEEYNENASLREFNKNEARSMMEDELRIIDRSGKEGVQKQQAIAAAKAAILDEFTGKLKNLQKDGAEGIQVAIKFFVTDAAAAKTAYQNNVDQQYAAVLAAVSAYQERLQVLKGMNLTEIQMDLHKLKIKKEIETEFAEHKLKEARRGFAIVDKEEKRSGKSSKKTSKNAQKYTRQAFQGFKSLTEALVADMADVEVSTLQAWKNMGAAALKMITDSLFEFALAEGLKQAFATETAAVKIVADTKAATFETAATASSIAQTGLKTKTAVVGAGLEAQADSIKHGADLGWWGIPIGMAVGASIFAVIMGLMGKFAKGGLVTGGIPGVDSVPILAQQGEYVLPKNVVDSIRAGTPPGATPMGSHTRGGAGRPQIGMPAFAGMSQQQATNVTVFSPTINTMALPNSAQNQRYYRDTVIRTKRKLNRNGYGV